MRIKRGVNGVKKRRKILKLAKGYFGCKSKNYRIAREAVMKSLNYAYIGRKRRKRDMRALWIARINRKVLADLAVTDAAAFADICNKAKAAI